MLTPRQKLILNAVIEEYVRSAEPVGSRSLSKHHDIQFSAATIRNEMADLEDMGYLGQPHTSAGRVPSQKGYRFYVDNLLQRPRIDPAAVQTLRQLFEQRILEVERVVQQTSLLLSHLTQQTAIVLGPRMYRETVRQIDLVSIGRGRAVVILVTDSGHVQDRHVQLSEDIAVEDLTYIVKMLNGKLKGVPLSRLRSHMYREIAEEMASTVERYEDALAVLEELCHVRTEDERVYVGGAANILNQPEFRDVEKVKPLIEMLERADAAVQLLPSDESGLQVRIGQENSVEPLQDCTVISATYSVGGSVVGRIGVLGPTRMDYARVMQILDYTSRSLTKILTDWTSVS